MEAQLKTSIWRQFGAVIDYLADNIRACPDHLWLAPLWAEEQPRFAPFWYRAYHTLFWLDLYLTGAEEGFVPPPPFALIEQDDGWKVPESPYTKAELLAYLRDCRERCRATINGLTDDSAWRICRFGWGSCSFVELLIYNLRHVQEHSGQLNLFLGQQGISTPDYETQIEDDAL
jgi:hypothetical protein